MYRFNSGLLRCNVRTAASTMAGASNRYVD